MATFFRGITKSGTGMIISSAPIAKGGEYNEAKSFGGLQIPTRKQLSSNVKFGFIAITKEQGEALRETEVGTPTPFKITDSYVLDQVTKKPVQRGDNPPNLYWAE